MIGERLRAHPFLEDDAGSLTIFAFVMLMMILLLAGASVDFTRYESTRAQLQNTLDRSVLAAADLDQKADPDKVVRDYMTKAGLGDALTQITVDDGLNYRTVTASGQREMDTVFLRMAGMDTMTAPALSAAEEKISNVEISLVLDVSGSMAHNGRIGNMKDAAEEFIETVVQPAVDGSGLTTVSIVPYNSAVNLGAQTGPYWNIENTHAYSHCAMFDNSDFMSVPIDDSLPLRRMGHFDIYTSGEYTSRVPVPLCGGRDSGSVVVHSSDKPTLLDRIGDLDAYGGTAIHVGLKWGAALLDPSSRPVVHSMAQAGYIAPDAENRPASYSDPEAIKFIVVMTDGANTSEYDFKARFDGTMSPVFVDDRGTSNPSDDRFSVLVRDHSGTYHDVYFRERYEHNYRNRYSNQPDGGSNARRMSHQELYARFSARGLANRFFYRPYADRYISYSDYIDYKYPYTDVASGSTVDSRLENICTASKNAGIVIFAIAFEAPDAGKEDLLACASSASHFFEVEGIEITETFHAIARQINSLRLIQ
ncbi:MAG: pilus assembly protein TadG-related protein [Pelagimonas sp.]|jgi:Flp pilus assembly protein TadG|nr:pilus assembly protein TadG-related protein [Pelagimonas sp.]